MKRTCLTLFAVALVLLLLAFPVLAQDASGSNDAGGAVSLAQKVIILAGVVSAIVQGVKKMYPKISGPLAVTLSVLASLAITFATAEPGTILSFEFIFTAIGTALSAGGIHGLLRPQHAGG